MFCLLQMLVDAGLQFDCAFTSVLKRSIKTLYYIQDALDLHWIPVYRHWRLNERMYGALQGRNKSETAREHGEAQVKVKHAYSTFSFLPFLVCVQQHCFSESILYYRMVKISSEVYQMSIKKFWFYSHFRYCIKISLG